MEGEDFFFPLIDEDVAHFEMAYRRPRDECAPFKKEPKIQGCEKKDKPQVPQYKTTVSYLQHTSIIIEQYTYIDINI